MSIDLRSIQKELICLSSEQKLTASVNFEVGMFIKGTLVVNNPHVDPNTKKTSGRTGWIGVVIRPRKDGLTGIVWLVDNQGEAVVTPRGQKDVGGDAFYGHFQNYKDEWVYKYIGIVDDYIHFNLLPSARSGIVKEEEGLWIVWAESQTSSSSYDTEEGATKAAVDLSLHHNCEYFVCKKTVSIKPIKRAKVNKL